MKNALKWIAAASVVTAGSLISMPASAHQRGDVCRYKTIDRDGDVRNRTDYCHHLPRQFRGRPGAGLTLYFSFGDGFYVARQPRFQRGNGEQVCLVTFFRRSQVDAGADANVQRARVMTRREAERRDGPNDRNRIFDYGSNQKTRQTCRYLDRINN